METPEQQLDGLSAAQRRLVELWLRREQAEAIIAPHSSQIPGRQATGAIPLSFAQQRLWFLHQLEPRSPASNLQTAVRLAGRLDVAALERSLDALMERHEALRSTFCAVDGQPRQVVAPAAHIPLALVALDHLPPGERDAQVRQLALQESAQPFDLEHGPLLRAHLLRLAADEHILLLTTHQIVCDEWSWEVLIRDLAALYGAASAGQPVSLPPLPVQYADFATWQRERLQGSGVWGQESGVRSQESGVRSQEAAVPLPPPAGGGTEGGTETRPPSPNTHPPSPIQAQLDYWQRQLAGAPAVLDLPTDHPLPPSPTFRGARRPLALEPELAAALDAGSERAGIARFVTLLAAFQVLLHRLSGQDDIVVGTRLAGRTRPELEGLAGCFANTLVLRTSLAGNPRFVELLDRVREVTQAACAHQDLPFEALVEALRPGRDLNRTPLFQVLFQVEDAPLPAIEAGGLSLAAWEAERATAQFDLALIVRACPQGPSVAIEYACDLFEATTIERMIGHFQVLLHGIVATPDRRLAELPLLTDAEREQLGAWNATRVEFRSQESGVRSAALCIHDLFEAQAARTPDTVALVFDRPPTTDHRPPTTDHRPPTTDHRPPLHPFTPSPLHPFTQHLSYRELNERANRLAHHLRVLGVGPEVRVAVCLERSIELLVALLGVLKAGGAYLPMDPAYPQERLAFMLEDAQAAVLITSNHLETRRHGDTETRRHGDKALQEPRTKNQEPHDCENQEPGTDGELETQNSKLKPQTCTPSPCHLVTLSESWPAIAAKPPDNPACRTRPENLAYVIYTSGSTGTPKGVAVPHGGLLNLVFWHQRAYGLSAADRATHLAGLAFDAAVWEVWPALAAGASVALADEATRTTPARLRDWLLEQAITISFLPTPLAEAVLRLEWPARAALRAMLTGGDQLRHYPAAGLPFALLNHYGPTEASVVATAGAVPALTAAEHLPPIGRPIANTQVYLLDRYLQPVPVGVAGELYIAGAGLARGYLDRPDLTAERFVPNPFAQGMGDGGWGMEDSFPIPHPPSPIPRLYKTGDLARYRPDGMIEFLGRIDDQVKVRGFRIELGEVELALRRHPNVREAVVVAREDAPGDKRLVAYVVQGSGVRGQGSEDAVLDGLIPDPRPLIPALRGFLQAHLPEYMIPSAFVLLDALPLTPHGKIDRRALPAPESAGMEKPFVAPRTPIEERLAQIWAEVLDTARVGVHDDFFALGGHSLQATQLISRVRESFQIELPLRSMFEVPTVAALAERIMVVQREQPGVLAPKLAPAGRDQALPLSFAQQRLWFIDQLQPLSPVYNIPSCVRMSGPLDRQALRRSLDEIVRRHEALRTTFAALEGQPVQVIRPPEALPLPLIDLQAQPEDTREDVALRLAGVQARRPFDLARGPLLRCLLLWLGQGEHILVLTMHHIVSDGWSMGVFIRELTALYTAFAASRPSPLPPLPVQYADFAIWQRGWLQGAVLERQLAYWRHQLREPLAVLELPTARPRPPVQTFRGAVVRFTISQPLTEALKALSRRAGATLYMTLLAAFKTLFYRYTGQKDISIGSSIANRNWEGYEGLIGFFVNTLVMRTDLSGNPPFRELLGRVRRVALNAYDHQDVPFEKLAEDLRPNRDPSYTPWFQVLFVLQNAPLPALEVAGLTLRTMGIDSGTAKFDMTLSLFENPQGMRGAWGYNTDLFDEATVSRMVGHFQVLLESMVADPDRRLADLALVTEAERERVLVGWNATAADYPTDVCIHTLIATQATRTPDAVAVVFDQPTTNDQRPTIADHRPPTSRSPLHPFTPSPLHPFSQHLTYRELNTRSNRLAHHLRTLGVGPEVRVGVCLERSPELIVGVLGVLMAGGAYVPLDPNYPAERLAFMLKDSQAPVLLTQQRLQLSFTDHTVRIVCIDADWDTTTYALVENQASSVTPDNLAYVIYTSGSTGAPKGVMVAHASLANAYLAWEDAYQLRSDITCHLQMANCTFDVFSGDLARTLCSGAKLVLCPRDLLLDAAQLYALMCREQVDSAEFVPVVLRNLAHYLEQTGQSFSFMRLLIVGSDSWYMQEYQQIQSLCGPVTRLVNSYGVSEATIDSSYFEESRCDLLPDQLVPIGRPFANTRLYVLDALMQPMPLGVPGELCIGGTGLARGYLNRPDLTAERFIPNPFGEGMGDGGWGMGASPPSPIPARPLRYACPPSPGTRLYKTGDLTRYLADGTIEFLGRIDDQVKVRGFRIELGEIETVLGQHPAVGKCTVLAREDVPGDKQLVAYVGLRAEGRGLSGADSSVLSTLRAFLRERLPEYMVPSAFVLLDSLPLTPSGKVDRRALPAPDTHRLSADEAFVAPRTPVEEVVAGVWADVLGLTQVGVDDNFFALGGHSLLAIQVVARLRATFQVELPVRTLFEAPTVALLAAHLDRSRRALMGLQEPPLRPRAWAETAPLSFAQQRLWFLDQLVPGTATYNLPLSVRLRGALDVAALSRSLDEIVRRHEALRTTFATLGGQPVQVIAPPAPRPLAVVDLQALPADEREAGAALLIADEAQRPFDLAHGPLVTVALMRLKDQQHLVLLNMHHIIADAWSMGVLLRELATLYSAFAAGQPIRLPELPVQYADYALWQQQWLQGAVLEQQLAYWKGQLGGALPLLELPSDRPRPPVQSFRGAQHTRVIPPTLSEALGAFSRSEGATLFMTLLTAFQVLLSRYSGQDDILVGSPIANRTQRELEGLIGFFVNTLVLRTDLHGNPPFRILVQRVREVCLDAYAHQDLPFERLVEELQPERDLSRAPLFQVMFVLQNAPMQALELPGLTLAPLRVEIITAKFDLTLALVETAAGLQSDWEYNADLFDPSTIARMAGHFEVLLAGVVAAPDRRLAELPLLTDAERQQLLVAFNATATDYPQERCLHELVAAQAARTPDAVALVFDRPPTTDHRPPTTDQRPTNDDQRPTSIRTRYIVSPTTNDDRSKTNDEEPRTAGFQEPGTDDELKTQNSKLKTQNCTPSPLHPFASQCLTYRELNRRANQLAHHLQQLGVGPEVRVAICMERSLELVIGLLGVLKAGGAYVPLDPAYPPDRLAFMLDDAEILVLLTQQQIYDLRFTIYDLWSSDERVQELKTQNHGLSRVEGSTLKTPEVVRQDADWPAIAGERADAPASRVCAANPAYVIYTSGSTGRPKGVVITHHAVLNLISWHQHAFHVRPQDRATQLASPAFDATVWELWPYLTAGASIHLPNAETQRSPVQLHDWLLAQAITICFLPTPLAERVLALEWPAGGSLRTLLTGGDTLQHYPPPSLPFALVNNYGPTENTVVTTSGYVLPVERMDREPPIGRPIANTQVYLLDRHMQPLPLGVAGELYVGGVQLARGYLDRPDLTAERFLPNPFGGVMGDGCWVSEDSAPVTQDPSPNTRLYRTGDLARYRVDGVLEFVGRVDEQIKLRGFRIELGEIAAMLAQHPAVRECAVVVREAAAGEKRLVAYLVTSHKSQVTSSPDSSLVTRYSSLVTELRAFLAERLPDYMVPSAFVALEALPLTPNGKLDRRALPAPQAGRGELETSWRAPRTPLEEVVANVWADVLGVAQVGVEDNFFVLGGHSLLATQVVARLRDAFAVELPVRALFEAPTVAALAAQLDDRLRAQAGFEAPPLRPIARGGPLPLSFAQQRLWFLDQLLPGSATYIIPLAVRLRGALDLAALSLSLSEIVRRHETLRTTFATLDGQPFQLIALPTPLRLTVLDLQALAADARTSAVERLQAAAAQQPFDLARGPLVRLALLRLEAHEQVLLLTLHHIIADAWSLGVLVRELAALYRAFRAGQPNPLPPLPFQYADYALWQQHWLQGAVLDRQLAYWKGQLGGALPLLELPTDRPRPPLQTFRGAQHSQLLPPTLSAALGAFSRAAGATLFMTLLAAFQTLLMRYSSQDDIAVGSPIANRTQRELEGLIGFFVNTLVLRSDLRGNPPFRDLVLRVREVCLDAYAHQDLPFERLVEELQPERDLSRHPLFQVMFVLQNAPLPSLELPSLTLTPLPVAPDTAKFDLTVALVETAEGLQSAWEYNADLFDAATITRMAGHFQMLLEEIVAAPERRLADLPLLTDDERQQLLMSWNATQATYLRHVCVHELFAAQAARTPDAIALVFDRGLGDTETEDRRSKIEDRGSAIFHPRSSILDPQSLTYRELNERANRLAHHLRMLGVGPEVRVGVCMERSIELVVGLLGVLKAGGAYVPIDPDYPDERLAFMLADAQVSVVLAQKSISDLRFPISDLPPDHQPLELKSQISNLKSPIALCLDSTWDPIAHQHTHNPLVSIDDDLVAFVIYTSGSTGQPKGTLNLHRGLTNYILWLQQTFPLTPDDRVLYKTSISFDVSLEEILWPLMIGAQMVVARSGGHQDTEYMARLIAREQITFGNFVPSLLAVLLEEPELARCTSLRQVFVGGEALTLETQERFFARQEATLTNLYGPSEAAISTTFWPCPRQDPHRLVPIGRPIANVQVYVLDRSLQPVPVGVPGELYIGGAGLARGYLNRPDLTAERFVPNPFAGVLGDGCWVLEDKPPVTQHPSPNTRLYRTGDLARYRADGVIEFLGRLDHQVKLRGLRIELGEIERILLQHPSLDEAVVLMREDVPGDKRLVAYLVVGSGVWGQGSDDSADQALTSDPRSLIPQLRAFLAERLPDYMLPSAFVLLSALPLLPSGKLDRRALPAPQAGRGELETSWRAPRTPVEEVVAEIWADVLGVGQLGVDDNFFALGGHSLLATQVVARLREVFAVELPVRALFEAPTVAGLAAHLDRRQRAQAGLQAPPLRPVARGGPLPLSFAQQRLWFLDRLQPGLSTYSLPSAVRLRGALNVTALSHSLSEIVRRHEALRTTFATLDEQPVQVLAPPAPHPLPLLDLGALPAPVQAETAQHLAAAEAARPFDLQSGPLLRTALLRLAPDDHMLLLTLHHIVSDGWSLGVLVNELATLYAAFAAGRPSPLAALPIQYADYALWQQQWLQGAVLDRQLAYWKGQLGGALPVLELPSDRPRPPLQSFRGAQHTLVIPPALSAALQVLNRAAGVTLFMTLLTVFQVLLSRYSGQEDILVGSPIANRTQRELEGLIGFFVNTLVLRTDLRDDPPFRVLLARVREVCLDAYAHQDLPFERLVEALQPTRDLSRAPLFQVLFTMQNAPLPPLELPGLILRPVSLATQTAKFDLALAVSETAEGLVGAWEYNTDLFDAATIARLDQHFQVLLEGIVAVPERRLADLPLLTEAERQLLATWNATQTAYPQDASIHALVAAQAARTPDAVAIVFDRPSQRQGDKETRGQGDKETKSQESGVRSQESEFLAPNPQSPIPLPPPARGGTEDRTFDAAAILLPPPAGEGTEDRTFDAAAILLPPPAGGGTEDRTFDAAAILLPPPAGGGTEGGRRWASAALSPQSLTYAELNRRANQLAHYLRSLGVGPEVRVGICLERSPELVIGLLGVLKAGGAYLPLDPAYPQERLAFMLEDAQVAVLLTTDQRPTTTDHRPTTNDHRVPLHPFTPSPCHLVTLSDSWRAIALCAPRDPDGALDPDNLAYLIYTSGSTGTPKGVAITHRSAVALLDWARTAFAPAQLAGVLAATSICFDLSVFELFVPLCWGGTVILAENVLSLASLLAAQDVTLINTVPSAMSELVRVGGIPASARTINLAGEPLPLALVQQLYQQATIEQVVNLYGPSEATTYATWVALPQATDVTPSIGRPIANTQVYLLDAQLQPVPIGVAGELYLGGTGLARGYLNRPDLTAERFIPNPFAGVLGDGCWVPGAESSNTQHPSPNTRLYKTGDRARYRPDGTIEYLGRLDEQVKIRGFRIEPGEIAAVLQQHEAVGECVVLAREDVPGEKRLVAYVVPTNDQRPTTNDQRASTSDSSSVLSPQSSVLRAFLVEQLPAYMIPSAFVVLDTLPLTANGKLDRRALPAPETTRAAQTASYLAPRDTLELALVQLWEALLGVAPVGVQDNFFALGGHSLLVVRLLARIQAQFGQSLPLATLFQEPTVAQLAHVLRRPAAAGPRSPLVEIQPTGSQRPFFCVHPGAGTVLCYLELARQLGTAQPFYALQAAGLEGEQAPRTRVEEMAATYLAALREVQPAGPYLLGGWSFGGLVAFEMAQQLHAQGEEVALLALIDSAAPAADLDYGGDDAALLAGFARDLARQDGVELAVSAAVLRELAPEQRLGHVLEQARAAGVLPPDIGEQQIRWALEVFAANLAAQRCYRPHAYTGRMTLFRAAETLAAAEADPTLGWGPLAAGGVALHTIPGDHYSIVRAPQVALLAERLGACIGAAQMRESTAPADTSAF